MEFLQVVWNGLPFLVQIIFYVVGVALAVIATIITALVFSLVALALDAGKIEDPYQ